MKKMFALVCMLAFVGPLAAQEEKYGRGHIPPSDEVRKARHAEAFKVHGTRIKSLMRSVSTPAKFDCRDFGWVPKVKDQGNCGSCYQFSGAMTCSAGFYKVGYKDQIGAGFAEQYGMDCHNWGGCNGGDEYDIIDWCKKNGLPTLADYGPYTARSGACKLKAGTKMWKIADFGFATSDQSDRFPTYQELKTAIFQYGAISVAGSANGWSNYSGGLFKDHGGQVDHAYMMIGWDDSKSPKGALLCQNQWSENWGDGGFIWVEYGANRIGTEPIWTSVAALPPPPPDPTPVPPGPGPLPGVGAFRLLQDMKAGDYIAIPKSVADMTVGEFFGGGVKVEMKSAAPKPCNEVEKLKGELDKLRADNDAKFSRILDLLEGKKPEEKKPEAPKPESKAKPKLIDGSMLHREREALALMQAKVAAMEKSRNAYVTVSHEFDPRVATVADLRREHEWLEKRLEAMSKSPAMSHVH